MGMKRGVPLPAAVLIASVLGWSPVAEADLELGQWVIRKGNTIEILGPDPSVDLIAIVDAIDDAASDNRYLIKLGPGVYDLGNEELDLKEFVSLVGSGQKTTEIVGDETYVISVPGKSTVSHLTVTLDDTSVNTAYALQITGSPTIRAVTARSLAAGIESGLYRGIRLLAGSPELIDVTVTVEGGESATGIRCDDDTIAELSRVQLTVKNGDMRSRGVWMQGTCSLTMRDVVIQAEGSPIAEGVLAGNSSMLDIAQGLIEVSGTTTNRGVYAQADADVLLHDVRVESSGGSFNFGCDATGNARLRIFRSSIGGDSNSINTSSSVEVIVSGSTLFSGVGGSAACVTTDDGAGNLLMPDCS